MLVCNPFKRGVAGGWPVSPCTANRAFLILGQKCGFAPTAVNIIAKNCNFVKCDFRLGEKVLKYPYDR